MDIKNFSLIAKTNDLTTSDFTLVVRNNEYQIPLAYKEYLNSFSNIFLKSSTLDSFKNQVEKVKKELADLSSTMMLRTEADSTYIKKETVQAKLPALITASTIETLTAQYATQSMMDKCAAQARAQAHKYADEMTDFTGAAMVGINQSQAANQLPPDDEGEGEENGE